MRSSVRCFSITVAPRATAAAGTGGDTIGAIAKPLIKAAGGGAAQTHGNPEITPDHITSALIQLDTPQADLLLQAAGTGAGHVLAQADARVRALPSQSGASHSPTFGREAANVLQRADTLMKAKGDTFLAFDLLLLALAETGHLAAVEKRGAADMEKAIDTTRGGRKVTSETPAEGGESLEKYGSDLTERAREGKLDPVIGRDEEIRRVIQVLSRRTKNNPVLIGEPGVGKTALAEGLAFCESQSLHATAVDLLTHLCEAEERCGDLAAAQLQADQEVASRQGGAGRVRWEGLRPDRPGG